MRRSRTSGSTGFADVPFAEVRREEHAYTIDSLRAGGLDPEKSVFLVGADEFAGFLTWKEPDEILERVRLGVATRPGYPAERLEPVLAALRRPYRVELFDESIGPPERQIIRLVGAA